MKSIQLIALVLILSGCDGASLQSASLSAESLASACNAQSLPFGGGSGTVADPYHICTEDQFKNLTAPYNAVHAVLDADLDFNAISFSPMTQFAGSLDGHNHTISNIYAHVAAPNSAGIWVSLAGSVKNLKIQDADFMGSFSGIIAADSTNASSVTEVHVIRGRSESTASTGYSGGVIGQNYGQITYSTSSATVLAVKYSGGISGYNQGLIQYDAASPSLSGSWVGRIAGINYANVWDCGYSGFTESGAAPVGDNQHNVTNCP